MNPQGWRHDVTCDVISHSHEGVYKANNVRHALAIVTRSLWLIYLSCSRKIPRCAYSSAAKPWWVKDICTMLYFRWLVRNGTTPRSPIILSELGEHTSTYPNVPFEHTETQLQLKRKGRNIIWLFTVPFVSIPGRLTEYITDWEWLVSAKGYTELYEHVVLTPGPDKLSWATFSTSMQTAT